jgi:site-specific DNA-cytosine methylase
MTLRALELYCGIGGCAAALAPAGAEVVRALDINHQALEVYRTNFPHPAEARTLESLGSEELAGWAAELWWLSPPCQPYTRRGLQRDAEDPRAASLLALLPRIAEVRPPFLGLENVPGFEGSQCHRRLRETLDGAGYTVREVLLCPTALGIPMRRRRFYLVASREGLRDPRPPDGRRQPLAAYLDPAADRDPTLQVPPDVLARYTGALDLVDPERPGAVTACFTSAYGRSPVRSGSYLQHDGTVRRFSPGEILRLLGFPADFHFPETLPLKNRWRLAGNSLAVDAVRYVMEWLPPLGDTLSLN